MIYDFVSKPENFEPEFKAAGCFLEYDARLLFLQKRDDARVEPGRWGHPAGKVKVSDDCIDSAVLREINEETGLELGKEDLFSWGLMCIRYPEFDFDYHVYRCNLNHLGQKPKIRIDVNEHQAYAWKTFDEARTMDLMRDEWDCLRKVYGL